MAQSKEINDMNQKLEESYLHEILKITLTQVIMQHKFKSLKNIPMDYLTQQLYCFASRLGSEIKRVSDEDHCDEPNVNHVYRAFTNMNLRWEDFDRFINEKLQTAAGPMYTPIGRTAESPDMYAPAELDSLDALNQSTSTVLREEGESRMEVPVEETLRHFDVSSSPEARETTGSGSSSLPSQSGRTGAVPRYMPPARFVKKRRYTGLRKTLRQKKGRSQDAQSTAGCLRIRKDLLEVTKQEAEPATDSQQEEMQAEEEVKMEPQEGEMICISDEDF